jgi:hypothetical protein
MSTNEQVKTEENVLEEIDEQHVEQANDQFFEQAKNDKISQAVMSSKIIPDTNNKKTQEKSIKESVKAVNKKPDSNKSKIQKKPKIDDSGKAKKTGSKLALLPFAGVIALTVLGGIFASNYYSDKEDVELHFNETITAINGSIYSGLETVNKSLSAIKTDDITKLKEMVDAQRLTIFEQQKQIDEIIKAKQSTQFGGESLYYEFQALKKEFDSKDLAITNVQNQLFALQNKIGKVDFNKLAKVNLNKIGTTPPPQKVAVVKNKKTNYAKTLYTINGFSLFSIDMFGSEKIAVFTKGLESKKVRVSELFNGYSIDSILSDSGVVYFNKNSKRYSMRVKA